MFETTLNLHFQCSLDNVDMLIIVDQSLNYLEISATNVPAFVDWDLALTNGAIDSIESINRLSFAPKMLSKLIKTSALMLSTIEKFRIVRPKINGSKKLRNSRQKSGQTLGRCMSTDSKTSSGDLSSDYDLPPLMNIKMEDIGNKSQTSFAINFNLKPFVDKDFDIKQFIKNAKQVSNRIRGRCLTSSSTYRQSVKYRAIWPMITSKASVRWSPKT